MPQDSFSAQAPHLQAAPTQTEVPDVDLPVPVGAAEHRRYFAMKRASCLSDCVFRNRELGARAKYRGAQGTREAGKPSGCLFFWLLFFGQAKKSNPHSQGGKTAKKRQRQKT